MSPEELLEDGEAIGRVEADPSTPPEQSAKSLIHTLAFPAQEHKLTPGAEVRDPATGKDAGALVELDDEAGSLRLRRGPDARRHGRSRER